MGALSTVPTIIPPRQLAIHTADVLTHEGYSHQTHCPEVVYIDRGLQNQFDP